jgi:hypothetical protein
VCQNIRFARRRLPWKDSSTMHGPVRKFFTSLSQPWDGTNRIEGEGQVRGGQESIGQQEPLAVHTRRPGFDNDPGELWNVDHTQTARRNL